MAKSSAERQRDWRRLHQSEPQGNRAAKLELVALRARVAELEALLTQSPWPGDPKHFRLVPELEEEVELTRDEAVFDQLLGYMIRQPIHYRNRDEHLLPCLIDLLKRAPAAFLDGCERAWAETEAQLEARRKDKQGRLGRAEGKLSASSPAQGQPPPLVPDRYRRYSLRNRGDRDAGG